MKSGNISKQKTNSLPKTRKILKMKKRVFRLGMKVWLAIVSWILIRKRNFSIFTPSNRSSKEILGSTPLREKSC